MSYRRLLSLLLVATVPAAAACTSPSDSGPEPPVPAPAMRLVAFDSCDDLVKELRKAAQEAVGPYGFGGGGRAQTGMLDAAPGAPAGPAAGGRDSMEKGTAADTGSFSQTNNHEREADEPDIVKTDGRRIVTVDDRGVLRVVDAASRAETGRLDLDVQGSAELLLTGNTALVLVKGAPYAAPDLPFPGRGDSLLPRETGSRLLTVDLTGAPRVVSNYRPDGTLLDARLTGTTARVVLRSAPEFDFPMLPFGDDDKRVAAYRKVINAAPTEAWLPRYEITTGGRTDSGRISCDRVSRPKTFSGSAMLTVLSFDLARAELTAGDPATVMADGDTVYATGTSLYVANDQRWLMWRAPGRLAPESQRTEIYRFEANGPGRPSYAAAGTVPGWLINQYALSEWNGHLRVATTVDSGTSRSGIHVLRQRGGALEEAGKVDGLGKGERIYSVRFLGPRGYVVTFRQTDPLYSVDLTDPAKPAVTGELKVTGYSSHLQPAGENRLLGIGQEATTEGRVTGTQVSLFDVSDPRKPTRLARHQVTAGQSEAEYDPHALLYWPATGLLVVPLTVFDARKTNMEIGALALRVTDRGITEVGSVTHPRGRDEGNPYAPTIRRSLVIGDVLWTVSDGGLRASNLSTLDNLAWLPAR